METNDTETQDLAEFEVFDYRDVVNVISYTLMSSGLFLFVDLCLKAKLVEKRANKQTMFQKRIISVGIILNTLALVVARKQSSRKEHCALDSRFLNLF